MLGFCMVILWVFEGFVWCWRLGIMGWRDRQAGRVQEVGWIIREDGGITGQFEVAKALALCSKEAGIRQ